MKTRRIISKLVASTVIAFTVFSLPVGATSMKDLYENTVYQYVDSENLGSGIVHENFHIATTYGKWNINVLRIDTSNKYAELRGLINPEGLHYRDSVSAMVNKHGAVAGVNGDYFDYSPVPTSLGSLINNGQVISSPIMRQHALPTFYLDEFNKAQIEYFERQIMVKNKSQNGNILYADNLNKVNKDFSTISILDKNFGHQSIGARFYKDMVEVVVDNNRVVEVREGWDPTYIPREGYVILARGAEGQKLKSFQPGDELELIINLSPSADKIKFAIGGGSTILRDGQYVNTNIADSGRNPRTGIGFRKDSNEIILVTVDGRNSSIGMTQKEFSNLMKLLGASDGLNLDGGGSTTMAVKSQKEEAAKLVNKPSGGSQRKVVNGVGVFNQAPKGVFDRIEIGLDSSKMMKDARNYVYIRALDAHGHTIELDTSSAQLEFEGLDHEFENNFLRPLEAGQLKISASFNYNGKIYKASQLVEVYSDAIDLYAKEKEIQLDTRTEYSLPSFMAVDRDGREAPVNFRDIDFKLLGDIGELRDNKLISNSKSGYIVASFKEGLEIISVNSKANPAKPPLEIQASSFKDPLNTKGQLDGQDSFRLVVLSEGKDLEAERKSDLYGQVKNSSVAISLNGFSEDFNNNTRLDGLVKINTNHGYSLTKKGPLAIINIDSRKGSIMKTNSYQLIRLAEDLAKLKEKHIIISTHLSPEKSSDAYEFRRFQDSLKGVKDADSGKNIFVVHGGSSTSLKYRDGIRYIGLDTSSPKKKDQLEAEKYLEFIFKGQDLNFVLEKLYVTPVAQPLPQEEVKAGPKEGLVPQNIPEPSAKDLFQPPVEG